MPTISDIIENFILSTLGKDDSIDLSRNELADYFKCAPSQINYVLTTRFNLNRGYIIQSQRGGGGYIKLLKIKDFDPYNAVIHVRVTKTRKPLIIPLNHAIVEILKEYLKYR